jgi:hypothetical protein
MQQTDHPITAITGSPDLGLDCILGLQVAGFTAGTAIINAIFAQADFIQALAQRAVFVAAAGTLRLVTDHA